MNRKTQEGPYQYTEVNNLLKDTNPHDYISVTDSVNEQVEDPKDHTVVTAVNESQSEPHKTTPYEQTPVVTFQDECSQTDFPEETKEKTNTSSFLDKSSGKEHRVLFDLQPHVAPAATNARTDDFYTYAFDPPTPKTDAKGKPWPVTDHRFYTYNRVYTPPVTPTLTMREVPVTDSDAVFGHRFFYSYYNFESKPPLAPKFGGSTKLTSANKRFIFAGIFFVAAISVATFYIYKLMMKPSMEEVTTITPFNPFDDPLELIDNSSSVIRKRRLASMMDATGRFLDSETAVKGVLPLLDSVARDPSTTLIESSVITITSAETRQTRKNISESTAESIDNMTSFPLTSTTTRLPFPLSQVPQNCDFETSDCGIYNSKNLPEHGRVASISDLRKNYPDLRSLFAYNAQFPHIPQHTYGDRVYFINATDPGSDGRIDTFTGFYTARPGHCFVIAAYVHRTRGAGLSFVYQKYIYGDAVYQNIASEDIEVSDKWFGIYITSDDLNLAPEGISFKIQISVTELASAGGLVALDHISYANCSLVLPSP